MMSEPMVFCREIECSGVSNLVAVNQKGSTVDSDITLTLGSHHGDSESVHPLR